MSLNTHALRLNCSPAKLQDEIILAKTEFFVLYKLRYFIVGHPFRVLEFAYVNQRWVTERDVTMWVDDYFKI